MSRLTGKEVYSLMEAYQAVYAPQELTEEQVWEGVENWVQSLLEEGYDLSDYTWEEMYESYLSEGPYDAANVQRVQQVVQAGQDKRDADATKLKAQRRSQDVADYRKSMLPPTAAKTIPTDKKPQSGVSGLSAADRAAYSGGGGNAAAQRGMGQTTAQVIAQGKKNIGRFDGGPRQGNPNIVGSPVLGPRIVGSGGNGNTSSTPAKPVTPAAPTARPAPSSKPDVAKTATPEKKMGGDPMDQWARANPTLAAKVKPGSSGYNTIKTRLDADNDRQENYDAYDLVLSHLINEGYADTEEAALAIMGNMSEDWRESIVEEVFDEARRADKLGYERGTAANPNIRNISHSDPSQRTMLNSKVRRRAEEMGRERRNSPKYKQGARPPLSAKEKSFLKFADRSSPTSGNPRNPNVQDTGSQTTWPSERRAQKDPKQNPKHNANRDNDK